MKVEHCTNSLCHNDDLRAILTKTFTVYKA